MRAAGTFALSLPGTGNLICCDSLEPLTAWHPGVGSAGWCRNSKSERSRSEPKNTPAIYFSGQRRASFSASPPTSSAQAVPARQQNASTVFEALVERTRISDDVVAKESLTRAGLQVAFRPYSVPAQLQARAIGALRPPVQRPRRLVLPPGRRPLRRPDLPLPGRRAGLPQELRAQPGRLALPGRAWGEGAESVSSPFPRCRWQIQ